MSVNTNRGTIHTSVPLSNLSVKFANPGLIGPMVFPYIGVANDEGSFYTFGREDFRIAKTRRADKADLNYDDSYSGSKTTYACEEEQLADLVSDTERQNADAQIMPDMTVTENLTNKILLGIEKSVADIVTAQATYASTNRVQLSSTQQWNNASFSSTSKTDAIEVRIRTAKAAIRKATGFEPNALICSGDVADVIAMDSAIRTLRYYTEGGLVQNGGLPPMLFGLKPMVANGVYDSADEGATYTGADVWGKHCIIAYINPAPAIRKPTFGNIFRSKPLTVKRFRNDLKDSDVISVSTKIDVQVVSALCGYLIEDCIA